MVDRMVSRIGEVGRRVVPHARRVWAHRPLQPVRVAGIVAALLLVLVVAVARGGDEPTGSEIPRDLPPRIDQDLRDLHEAVNG